METISLVIIVLLSLVLILLLFLIILLLTKKNKNNNLKEEFLKNKLESNIIFNSFREDLILRINDKLNELDKINNQKILESEKTNSENLSKISYLKEQLVTSINKDINELNLSVKANLSDNLKETINLISSFNEKLARITEAQNEVKKLTNEVSNLGKILGDKKLRGNFGEFQLETIVYSIFGEPNDINKKIYQRQFQLSNKNKVDMIINCPEPLGIIPIDSKFPLENFKRYIEASNEEEKNKYKKEFSNDVKLHIKDISTKYIIPNETSNYAIMFVPSETIFSEINVNFSDLILTSQKSNVWITSPTTLLAVLTIVYSLTKNLERNKNILYIEKEIFSLSSYFQKFEKSMEKIQNNFNSLNNSFNETKKISDQIIKKFDDIENVNCKES